jgi:acyl-CoA synthetase (AMP-forming)/AMP-acid ligase II
MLTHEGLRVGAYTRNLAYRITSADRILRVAQLGVAGTLIATWCLTCLGAGASMVIAESFEPGAALRAIADHEITTVIAVPIFFSRMAENRLFDAVDLSRFAHAVTGGDIVTLELLERFKRRGVPLLQSYGMTEACASAVCLRTEESATRHGSSGIPLEMISPQGCRARSFSRGPACCAATGTTQRRRRSWLMAGSTPET